MQRFEKSGKSEGESKVNRFAARSKKYEKEFFCFPCSCCRVENNVAQNFCLEKYEHYNPTKEIGDENVKKKDFLRKEEGN